MYIREIARESTTTTATMIVALFASYGGWVWVGATAAAAAKTNLNFILIFKCQFS